MAEAEKTKDYTVVKTGMHNVYHDAPDTLLHAAFQILVDFVEKEKALEVIHWHFTYEERQAEPALVGPDYYAEMAHVGNEIKDLYEWWTQKYMVSYRKHGVFIMDNTPFWVADEIAQKQFMRLAEIREYLWT
jgi:exonuclease III